MITTAEYQSRKMSCDASENNFSKRTHEPRGGCASSSEKPPIEETRRVAQSIMIRNETRRSFFRDHTHRDHPRAQQQRYVAAPQGSDLETDRVTTHLPRDSERAQKPRLARHAHTTALSSRALRPRSPKRSGRPSMPGSPTPPPRAIFVGR